MPRKPQPAGETARTIPLHHASEIRWESVAATVLFLLALTVWLAGLPLAADEQPDLTGTWELDENLSEDPMQSMRERPAGRGGRGGGRGGGGWSARPGGPGGAGPGGTGGRPSGFGRPRDQSGESPEEMRQRMEQLRESLQRMNITQGDQSVHIVFADGHEQVITTNNKKQTIETPFGDTEVKARWRDGTLQVRRKIDRRITVETWYLASDRSLLTIVVESSSQGPSPLAHKRIYRPAAEPEAEG